jgi:hypothetical protein
LSNKHTYGTIFLFLVPIIMPTFNTKVHAEPSAEEDLFFTYSSDKDFEKWVSNICSNTTNHQIPNNITFDLTQGRPTIGQLERI